jgi:anti-sigma regulatory factor (Ser/Thr protein kinase)
VTSAPDALRLELPADPCNVATARAAVRRALGPWPHLQDTGALLVSELATNAVLHAGGRLLVEVRVVPDAVRIAVSDTSPVLPRRKLRGLEACTGRGLGLVALLSSASGCERTTDPTYRKTTWFELRLDAAAQHVPDDGALLLLSA